MILKLQRPIVSYGANDNWETEVLIYNEDRSLFANTNFPKEDMDILFGDSFKVYIRVDVSLTEDGAFSVDLRNFSRVEDMPW